MNIDNIDNVRESFKNGEYLEQEQNGPRKRRPDLRGDTVTVTENGLLQQQAEQALLRHLALEGEVAFRRDQAAGQLEALTRELAALRSKREALITEAKRLGVDLQL